MKTNIGSVDRIIRLVIGFALLGVGLVLQSWWGLVGLIPILTAVVRICPAYIPFGIKTGSCSCSCSSSGEKPCETPKK
ncbi:MAG: DUF2892 domain-containing protein [Opitutus sp.]|nr:DUF2892 domain-containing protein [Opitutus sp.]MCS6246159.1 DUF2892 domain-containing protein [Opitutus sp.]MCS6272995.1 DUF2892 domain-containing protein [Opitutus sp.]MCS6278498.1 DUF2892 domain-containing protein [Opitutus sp.]MCS6300099.1 DUF2892 domain-containing protein [Opitutus sp.]